MSTTQYLVAFIVICVYSYEVRSYQEGFYTITFPGTIRSESVVHVSIVASGFNKSCWFNITLESTSAGGTELRHALKTVEVHPNTIKLVELQAPTLHSKSGTLEILGYRGVISRDRAKINFEHDSQSVFVQTSKAKYKTGELVEFRVICIDQLTRPAQIDEKLIALLIYDGQENLIKLIRNVKLVQGVFRWEFQLSDYPVLGEWKILVEVGGNVAAERSFQVAKYVLPEFVVNIAGKPIVALNESQITLTISAKYFYGEPVKGNLTILLEKTYDSSGRVIANTDLPIFEKKTQIEGSTTFILNMKNDLKIEADRYTETGPRILQKFRVRALVTDVLTMQQSVADTEIAVHSQNYKIHLQAPKMFDGSDEVLQFLVKVSVTDLENQPINFGPESVVKISVECKNTDDVSKTEFPHRVGNDDYARIEIENGNYSVCEVYAEFQGAKSPVERIKRNEDTFNLDVLTESPEVGKLLELNLKSKDPIEDFSYEIVSRGDIIRSEYVTVPQNQTTHIFRFNVTHEMVPKITIYAHRIKRRMFTGQWKDVYIKRTFQNSIEIVTQNETKPGALVTVNVRTDEGSYVGLMGLDHRLLENLDDGNGLSEDHLYTKLQDYDAFSIETQSYPLQRAGLVTFSNALTQLGSRFGEDDFLLTEIFGIFHDTEVELAEPFDKPSVELPRVRKMFSETWLYKDIESTPARGSSVAATVPDTITSWTITGFSLNPKTGLTLTKNATNLTVFQDFFVSIDLPSLATEGETIEVAIYVSNYLRNDTLTSVVIESDSDNLEIFKSPEVALRPKEAIQLLVPAGNRRKTLVYMKPLKPGEFNVTVKAFAAMTSDAVQKTLNVKHEGVPYEFSKTYLVHLPEDGTQEDQLTVDIPDQAVPGSRNVEISIVGDIFRPLLRSLQKVARVPYGHGEDNMRFIISNLLVLKYLKALNYSFPSLESKLKLNIELGYQNQLHFKHLDGSFGLFDRTTERSGDVWQTAFALWGLKQSKDFIHVDSKVFERGLNYLKTRQQTNGCFRSRNGIKEDIEHTALSVLVFLMDENWRTTHSEVLTKGLKYLHRMSDGLPGQSSVAVFSTYVLLLGRHEKAGDCLEKLASNAHLKSKHMFWKKPDTLQSHLEITCESLLNLFESQGKAKNGLLYIINGLIAFKEDGRSALSHMIALHAMLVFIGDLNLGEKNLTTFFRDDQNKSGSFQVNPENSQVLQKLKLSDESRTIHLQSKGYGFAVVSIRYKYNLVLENQSSPAYRVNITSSRSSNSLTIFKVCTSFLRDDGENHLTTMEVSLQSGYAFTEKITPDVGLTWKFRSFKVNDNQDTLVVHISNINKNGICLNLEALKKFKVLNAKPGWIVLYDGNEKDEKTVKSFKLTDS